VSKKFNGTGKRKPIPYNKIEKWKWKWILNLKKSNRINIL
jgi:hypothetical protein